MLGKKFYARSVRIKPTPEVYNININIIITSKQLTPLTDIIFSCNQQL